MKKIPFFNYPTLFSKQESDLMPIIQNVLRRGAYIMQEELFEFERHLASYLGVKHAIGVADGTMAMIMGLRAAGIGYNDEVILPSHTFVASAAAIHHVGGRPVLADCGDDHLVAADSIELLINENTRGIMPVQLNGRTANMERICSIANKHDLKIVEDSAQALGSKFKDRFAGTFGVAGTCSFYPSKTLGCFGDGGAVITDSDDVANYLLLLRDHGRDSNTGDVVEWGYNSRLDNLQAAVLNHKLKTYKNEIERRRNIALMYTERLCEIEDLVLPPAPDSDPDHYDIYQNYEIESSRRDALRKYLEENGVKTIIQWGGKTLHQYPKLNLGFSSNLPVTEAMTKKFFLLPMNTSLANDDIEYICDYIHRFYKRVFNFEVQH